jgi:hypothetical protein
MSMGYLYRSGIRAILSTVLGLGVLTASACGSGSDPVAALKAAGADAARVRDQAIASARVWSPPAIPVNRVDLRHNSPGPGAFRDDEDVSCRFKPETVGGLTPKFHCDLPSGDTLKVKYGSGNAELHAEVAATRLLAALGFPADRMYVVRSVRCAGCPVFPFRALQCLKKLAISAACFPGGIDYNRVITFDTAVIERRFEGQKIEAVPDQGWAWYELDRIDESRGGSPAAVVDALRLMAVVLAHWDNKAENQRLVCPPGAEGPDGTCGQPLAIIQDVGATFGPVRVDLNNWRRFRVWTDPTTCSVSMKTLPYSGATFVDRRISEEGRVMLLGLLEQLTGQQLTDLFESSRMTQYDQVDATAHTARAWVRAFQDKVAQIREAGPCPRATAS